MEMSWFVYVVRLASDLTRANRDQTIQYLRDHGVQCNNYFPCIHLEPLYRSTIGHKEGDFPIAESVSDRTIALPFYNNLSEEEQDYVALTLRAALDSL